jgi:hypothetical protein
MSYYDDPQNILDAYDRGYANFRTLCEDRQEAYYDRKERLQKWFVGRFMLDECGNTFTTHEVELPVIVGGQRFIKGSYYTYELRTLPPAEHTCCIFGEGWTLSAPFAVRSTQEESGELVHPTCENVRRTESFRNKLQKALDGKLYKLAHIPNAYWPKLPSYAHYADWFEVTLLNGEKITIGPRKSVISIEWRSELGDLFPECADTHTYGLVHTYDWSVAAERLLIVVDRIVNSDRMEARADAP